MRILVTGGHGFIGRHLAAELVSAGHHVRCFDSLVEQVHGAEPDLVLTETEFMRGDVRDREAVRQALDGMDCVVHLAAEVGVGQSMYEIARYVGANDLGTAILLEELSRTEVGRVVVASSMSVYGEGLYEDGAGQRREHVRRDLDAVASQRWNPADLDGRLLTPIATDETKPVDLASIYALTKYAQEQSVLIWAAAYHREAVALRLFNVFGPGQALSNPYTGVLANFASRLVNGERPLVFEDGRQQRDFVHVGDVALAFRLAVEMPDLAGETFNIGSGTSHSVLEVAQLLARAMGRPQLEPEILGKYRAGDIRNCFSDISKARDLLGFKPLHSLEGSLDELVEWVALAGGADGAPRMRRELEQRGLVA